MRTAEWLLPLRVRGPDLGDLWLTVMSVIWWERKAGPSGTEWQHVNHHRARGWETEAKGHPEPLEAGRGKDQRSPSSCRGSSVLLIPGLQTSGLQNC